jgi:aromatic ring-cleaving dioxygenase
MSERIAALICGVGIFGRETLYYRTDPGDPFSPFVIADDYGGGYYYPIDGAGHAAPDLVDLIMFLMQDILGLPFSVSMDRSRGARHGCLTWTKPAGAGAYLEISSRSNGVLQNLDHADELFAVLWPDHARRGDYTVIWSGAGDVSIENTRPCLGVVMPRTYFFSDIGGRVWRGATDSEWAAQNRVMAAKVLEARVGVRLSAAYPRGAQENEYHQLVDFLDLAAQGRPVLISPDAGAAVIYPMSMGRLSVNAPYGYCVGVLKRADMDWEPQALEDRWDARWERELTFTLPRPLNFFMAGIVANDLGVQITGVE